MTTIPGLPYLPNKTSSSLASEYSESLYSRIHIRIRHPVFAIRIVFVTWCIRSSPSNYPLDANTRQGYTPFHPEPCRQEIEAGNWLIAMRVAMRAWLLPWINTNNDLVFHSMWAGLLVTHDRSNTFI